MHKNGSELERDSLDVGRSRQKPKEGGGRMALLLLQMKKIRRRGLFGLPWVAWCCLLLLATIVEWVQTSRQAGMRALVLLGRVWGKEGRKTGSISTSRNLGRTGGSKLRRKIRSQQATARLTHARLFLKLYMRNSDGQRRGKTRDADAMDFFFLFFARERRREDVARRMQSKTQTTVPEKGCRTLCIGDRYAPSVY